MLVYVLLMCGVYDNIGLKKNVVVYDNNDVIYDNIGQALSRNKSSFFYTPFCLIIITGCKHLKNESAKPTKTRLRSWIEVGVANFNPVPPKVGLKSAFDLSGAGVWSRHGMR